MKVGNKHLRSIWLKPNNPSEIQIIDQRWLPHQFVVEDLKTLADASAAIGEMHVRGAPLIGATAAFGMYLAALAAPLDAGPYFREAAAQLKATRPTAINLQWAVDQSLEVLETATGRDQQIARALALAKQIVEEDVVNCRKIGEHGLPLIEAISKRKGGAPVHILTHCNAGWLACVDYGTATAPMYLAHDAGVAVHIWVDETRPRNQGARLTAWELGQHGIPHTVIPDNTGGHLMQHGMVDLVLVGSDRTTRSGDVANKIGTYLKALAAKDNDIPFYVSLPCSTFDWSVKEGLTQIPIEQRSSQEVSHIQGWHDGKVVQVQLTPENSAAVNYGFDVTPAHLVSGLITERGICQANEESILQLFPEYR